MIYFYGLILFFDVTWSIVIRVFSTEISEKIWHNTKKQNDAAVHFKKTFICFVFKIAIAYFIYIYTYIKITFEYNNKVMDLIKYFTIIYYVYI